MSMHAYQLGFCCNSKAAGNSLAAMANHLALRAPTPAAATASWSQEPTNNTQAVCVITRRNESNTSEKYLVIRHLKRRQAVMRGEGEGDFGNQVSSFG